MIINYKTKNLIIGNFKNHKINQIITEKGFTILENNLYQNLPNYKIMKKIIIYLKNNDILPQYYDYYINIGEEIIRLKFKDNKFYKNLINPNNDIYKFLLKNKKYFIKYKINKPIKILFQVIGGARTIFQTYEKMYHNLFSKLGVKYDIRFYLKEKDPGPKNNGGVNFVYHDLNKEDIIQLIDKYKYKGNIDIIFSDKDLNKEDKDLILNNRDKFKEWLLNEEILIRIMNFHYNLSLCFEKNKDYDFIFFTRPDIIYEKPIPFYLNYSDTNIIDFSYQNFNDFCSLIPNKLNYYFFKKPFEMYSNPEYIFTGPEQLLNYCIKDYYIKTDYMAKIERKQNIKKYHICWFLIGKIANKKIIKKYIGILNKYYYVHMFGYFKNKDDFNGLDIHNYKIGNLNYWHSSYKCLQMTDKYFSKINIEPDLIINMNGDFNINFFPENEVFYCIKENKYFFNIIKKKINIIDNRFIMGPRNKMIKVMDYYKEKETDYIKKIENKFKNYMDSKFVEMIKFTYYLYGTTK
jgi:hypothetical protein